MCDAAPDREVVTTRDSSQLRAGRSNNARSVQRNLLVTSAAEREGEGAWEPGPGIPGEITTTISPTTTPSPIPCMSH